LRYRSPFFFIFTEIEDMFNFFRKKQPVLPVQEKIWMTQSAKFQFLLDGSKKNDQLLLVCWFPDTYSDISSFFSTNGMQQAPLQLAREIRQSMLTNKQVIFAEHYPIYTKEKTVFEELGLSSVTICSSLDEPLFTHFGGERIIGLMKSLGMEESSAIEHPMITRSIRNAQEKIEKKLSFEQSATSQKDWFEKNFKQ
jgi:hypothetical protein